MRRSSCVQKQPPSEQQVKPLGTDKNRVHDRLAELNKNVLLPFTHTLSRDPAADLTRLFARNVKNYPSRRERFVKVTSDQASFEEYAAKGQKRNLDGQASQLPRPEGDLVIRRPLATQVMRLLTLSDGSIGVAKQVPSKDHAQQNTPTIMLLRAIEKGTLIYHLYSKFVFRLDEKIVVKFASDMDTDDAVAMEHIHSHAPDVRIPEPYGVASISNINYVFMSFIEGVSLDKLWSSLTVPSKQSIQSQLTKTMHQLRTLPLSPATILGSGEPRRCHDLRHISRTCPDEICSEEGFNHFLVANSAQHVRSIWLEMIKSRLRTDHKMVMTHSDLRPQNIMVKQHSADNIEITGIVDWGYSGVYPEYWEYVKACGGLRADSKTDWFDYLPVEAIGCYVDEYLTDYMIDRIHM